MKTHTAYEADYDSRFRTGIAAVAMRSMQARGEVIGGEDVAGRARQHADRIERRCAGRVVGGQVLGTTDPHGVPNEPITASFVAGWLEHADAHMGSYVAPAPAVLEAAAALLCDRAHARHAARLEAERRDADARTDEIASRADAERDRRARLQAIRDEADAELRALDEPAPAPEIATAPRRRWTTRP